MSTQRDNPILDLEGLRYYHGKITDLMGTQENFDELKDQVTANTTQITANTTQIGELGKTVEDINVDSLGAVPTAGGTITGNLTVNGNITIGTHNPAIKLTTEDFNYIKGTALSSIAFCLNDTANQANSSMFINATGANPGASDTYSLGTSSLKWKNVYATTFTGALSGNASSATTLSSTLSVAKGGTGATTAATALTNLGIVYSSTQPSYVAGKIWLKPV